MEGRFVSRDPIAILGNGYNNSSSLAFNQYVESIKNSYLYTDNNPINRTDPSGLIWVTVGYDYAGTSNWFRGVMNYITDRIGTGMSDPNVPGTSPNHYVGMRRDVIQEWRHDSNNPCRDSENSIGARRRITQTYSQFVNGGPRHDLTRNPDDPYYYQWSPWVNSPTY